MRGHHATIHARPQRSRCNPVCLRSAHRTLFALVLHRLDRFDTIKKPTQAGDAAHVSCDLPLTAKFELHDKHDQHDKDMDRIPVELEREEKRTSHRSTFPAPNVLALGAYCVKRSRAPKSRTALPSAINVIRQVEASPVYTEVA